MRKLIFMAGVILAAAAARAEIMETKLKNIAEVRTYFARHSGDFLSYIRKAQELRPLEIKPQHLIDLSECQKIRDKISRNYPVDPFQIHSLKNHGHNLLCGDEEKFRKAVVKEVYFEPLQQANAFGVSAKYAFLRFIEGKEKIFHGILLDENMKMISGFSFLLGKPQDISSAQKIFVWSLDQQGNYFSNAYSPRGNHSNSQQFFIKDGSYWGGRTYLKDEYGVRAGLEIFRQKATVQKDWDEVYLLPTLLNDNPFFKYGSTVISEATSTNELIEARNYRREVCAVAHIKRINQEQRISKGPRSVCGLKFEQL